MRDESKTKAELIRELIQLRREVALLKKARTGQERDAAALERSEAYFRAITQNSSDIVIIVDELATITYVSPSVERFVGYRPEELIGRSGFDLIAPEDNPRAIEDFGRALLTREVVIPNAFNIRHKDGTVRILEGVGKNLLDDPVVAGFVMNVRDVTDRIRADQERQRLEERLHRSEKMEALGTMAGGVAHDLNNALGVLIGYSELMLASVDEASPLGSHVLNVIQGGEAAAAVVRDLLTLARRGVQTPKALNLNTVIRNCLRTPEFEKLRSSHPEVQVKTELDGKLCNILGAPGQLVKTVLNLISNAAEAMPRGGRLIIRTANRHLDRPVRGYDDVRAGQYVVLTVSDTGGGIAEADMNHIFEPFYTKKAMGRGGTGLGLAVVWGVVQDCGGYVDVQTEVGKGSAFTLYFPMTTDPVADETLAVPISRYMGRGESILIVDDVKEQRDLAAAMLAKLNYNVVKAASGEEAVEYLRTHRADLLVLDMIMDPGINGLETYRRVVEIHPGQRAIIVSGFSETAIVSQVQALGAGEYVKKPYIQERIGQAVRRELDRTAQDTNERSGQGASPLKEDAAAGPPARARRRR